MTEYTGTALAGTVKQACRNFEDAVKKTEILHLKNRGKPAYIRDEHALNNICDDFVDNGGVILMSERMLTRFNLADNSRIKGLRVIYHDFEDEKYDGIIYSPAGIKLDGEVSYKPGTQTMLMSCAIYYEHGYEIFKLYLDSPYMERASSIAKLSKCKKRKVGAVVEDEDGMFAGAGCNRMENVLGDCDKCKRIDTRSGINYTGCKAVHAEARAILDAGPRCNGGAIYCTYGPCIECAKLIVAAGITEVYFLEVNDNMEGTQYLIDCGLKVKIWSI